MVVLAAGLILYDWANVAIVGAMRFWPLLVLCMDVLLAAGGRDRVAHAVANSGNSLGFPRILTIWTFWSCNTTLDSWICEKEFPSTSAGTVWLVLTTIDDSARFGLAHARFADPTRIAAHNSGTTRCDCAAPPCATPILHSLVNLVTVALPAFLMDYHFTRGAVNSE
eukprot:gene15737-biopygen7112